MKSFVAPNVTPVAQNGIKSGQMIGIETIGAARSTIGEINLHRQRRVSVAPMLDSPDKNKKPNQINAFLIGFGCMLHFCSTATLKAAWLP